MTHGPRLALVSSASGHRIGVFGGTFDPPHLGHIATALEVRHTLRLDRVLLVVANDPWQKTRSAPVTPAPVRLALTRAAVASVDGIEACDIEIVRGGPTYTADTLRELGVGSPSSRYWLLVGSDAAAGLDTWERPDDVRKLATTVVVDRKGREGGRPPPGWAHEVVDVPALEISSSAIRSRVRNDEPIRGLVPAAVADMIDELELYQDGQDQDPT